MSRTEASPRAQIWRRHWSSKRERSGSEPGMDRSPPNATIVAHIYATSVTDRQGPSFSLFFFLLWYGPPARPAVCLTRGMGETTITAFFEPRLLDSYGETASGLRRAPSFLLSFLDPACGRRPGGSHWGPLIRHPERGGPDRGLEAHPGGRGGDHARVRSRSSRGTCAAAQVIGAGRPGPVRRAAAWTLQAASQREGVRAAHLGCGAPAEWRPAEPERRSRPGIQPLRYPHRLLRKEDRTSGSLCPARKIPPVSAAGPGSRQRPGRLERFRSRRAP